jgi:hypothetical protein
MEKVPVDGKERKKLLEELTRVENEDDGWKNHKDCRY